MNNTVDFINKKSGNFLPEIALILGSGLGSFCDGLDGITIPYEDIPGFKKSTVKGHKGSLFFTELSGKKLVVMQGRFHFYEGHTLDVVTYPIKVFKKLGAKTIILTNAAGAVNKTYVPSDLMLIKDHINFMGQNPLVGANDDSMGERFPDMSEVYNLSLRKLALSCALEADIDLKEGVYIATSGPSYETPAEIDMFRLFGADAVGMSTAPEAIVANYSGMDVLGLSLITNHASGVSSEKLNHKEVVEMGQTAGKKFTSLVKKIISSI